MGKISCIAVISATFMLSACSNQQVYDAIQAREKVECSKLPQSSEYEECMQQQADSYGAYQKKREELHETQ